MIPVTIRWTNPNIEVPVATVEVFRSTAAIDPASPGAPLVTLHGGAIAYVDDSLTPADVGQTFYYLVGFNGAAYSDNVVITVTAGDTSPPIAPPPLTSGIAYAFSDRGELLYNKNGHNTNFSPESSGVPPLLTAIVAFEELITTPLEITQDDINNASSDDMSGLPAGTQLSWADAVALIVMGRYDDVRIAAARVLPPLLLARHGIGDDETSAYGFWRSSVATRVGAVGIVDFFGVAEPPHQSLKVFRFIDQHPTLNAYVTDTTLNVLTVGGATVVVPRRRVTVDVNDLAGNPTGYTLPNIADYGDDFNIFFRYSFPGGDAYFTLKQGQADLQLYQDVCRLVMATPNAFRRFRGAPAGTDPFGADVAVKIQGSLLDSSANGQAVTNNGASLVPSEYMADTAVSVGTAATLTTAAPDFAGGDFTIELYARGTSGTSGTLASGTGWELRIVADGLEFAYTTVGAAEAVVTAHTDALGFGSLRSGGPTHIVVMRRGDDLAIYANTQRGTVANVAGLSFSPAVGDMVLGGAAFEVDEFIVTLAARYALEGFDPRYWPDRWY